MRADSTVTGGAKTNITDESKREARLHIAEAEYQMIRVEHVPSSQRERGRSLVQDASDDMNPKT